MPFVGAESPRRAALGPGIAFVHGVGSSGLPFVAESSRRTRLKKSDALAIEISRK